jgi:hypothetical protein
MSGNDVMSTIQLIQKIIEVKEFVELYKNDQSKYRENLQRMFPTFAGDYPFLFKKVIFKQDLSLLPTILQSIDNIKNGENEKNITANIGEILAEKYLYPVLGKPESTTEKQPEFKTKQ